MFIAAFILTVLAAIIAFLLINNSKHVGSSGNLPYQKIGSLFTIAERSFFGVLSKSVGDDLSVFGKVRVEDVIDTVKGIDAADRQHAFNRISAKYFDFVLCDKKV